MELLIINYMALPVPPVKGGAVEHLIDMYLKYNENTGEHNITLYSTYNSLAAEESKTYNFTSFRYISAESNREFINKACRHLINRIPFLYIGNQYINNIVNDVHQRKEVFEKYDAIIVENAPAFGLILRRHYKGRLILHLHNDFLNKDSKLAKKTLECFDEVFVLSNYIGDRVKSIEGTRNIVTLYNGIDHRKFEVNKKYSNDIKVKFNIHDDEIVILYAGRLVPEKGVEELLLAFSKIETNHKVKLIIMGSAKYGNTVKDKFYTKLKTISSSFKDKVIFTGYISYSEIQKIYSIADIGVVPSLCNEGFNLTTVEFMANAIPIISSNQGALPEILNENCAIIVPAGPEFINKFGSAISELINNTDKRLRMGENGLNLSKKFTMQKYCDNYNRLLREKS